jgi:predicted dehydrogenase
MPAMPTQFPPVPKHLKWDLWLGPADDRKYSPDYCPYNWRFWWDFGTGETGNWGCHILDIPFWALDLGHPIKVSGKGPEVDPQRTPKEMFTTLHYPARGNKPPVKLHWSHTQKALPVFTENNIPNSGNTLFVGSKGFLLCDFDKRKLYPEDKFENFVEPPETIPASPGFHKEWINMCKGGPAATCNFDYTGPMTESVLLANVAYRVGGEFDWDPKTMRAQGRDDVDIFVRPKYRKGWEL